MHDECMVKFGATALPGNYCVDIDEVKTFNATNTTIAIVYRGDYVMRGCFPATNYSSDYGMCNQSPLCDHQNNCIFPFRHVGGTQFQGGFAGNTVAWHLSAPPASSVLPCAPMGFWCLW